MIDASTHRREDHARTWKKTEAGVTMQAACTLAMYNGGLMPGMPSGSPPARPRGERPSRAGARQRGRGPRAAPPLDPSALGGTGPAKYRTTKGRGRESAVSPPRIRCESAVSPRRVGRPRPHALSPSCALALTRSQALSPSCALALMRPQTLSPSSRALRRIYARTHQRRLVVQVQLQGLGARQPEGGHARLHVAGLAEVRAPHQLCARARKWVVAVVVVLEEKRKSWGQPKKTRD